VGQVHELLGPQRGGDLPGGGVGVDVVGLAGDVDPDRGDHGDQLLGEEALDDRRVDGGDVADIPEPRVAGDRSEQPAVLARQTDRQSAVHVDGGHDVAVDLADEDHA